VVEGQNHEQDIALVRIGQELEARFPAAPNRIFKARISAINSASDLTTRVLSSFRTAIRMAHLNPNVRRVQDRDRRGIEHAGGADRCGHSGRATLRPCGRDRAMCSSAGSSRSHQQDGFTQIRSGLNSGELVVGRGAIFVDNEWRQ